MRLDPSDLKIILMDPFDSMCSSIHDLKIILMDQFDYMCSSIRDLKINVLSYIILIFLL